MCVGRRTPEVKEHVPVWRIDFALRKDLHLHIIGIVVTYFKIECLDSSEMSVLFSNIIAVTPFLQRFRMKL